MNPASRQRPDCAAAQGIDRDIGMHQGRTTSQMLSGAEESRTDLGGACRA
jgi:hypothetical protein